MFWKFLRITVLTVANLLKDFKKSLDKALFKNKLVKKLKLQKTYKIVKLAGYTLLSSFITAKFLLIIFETLKASGGLKLVINLADLKDIIYNLISLLAMTVIAISSCFLPTNLLTIFNFVAFGGFLLYSIRNASFLSGKFQSSTITNFNFYINNWILNM